MPSLLDMTKVPMTNILEQCDIKSVLILRKVCHDLRNFINDANFKTDLNTIHIEFSERESSHAPEGNMKCCDVSLTFKSSFQCKRVTLNDLRILLNLQNSKLSSFMIRYGEEWDYINFVEVDHRESLLENSRYLDDLKDILKNKPRPLQTETIDLKVPRGLEVLKILPYLDSKVLKRITLMTPIVVRDTTNLDEIERIMELEQFKMACELTIDGFSVDADLKKFFHFEKICIKFQEIPIMDLVALKEAFTTSPHMEKFWLHHYIMDNDEFEKKFGVPSKETEPEDDFVGTIYKKWYFKMKTSKDDVLEINFASFGLLSFKRIRAADVEENVIVRD
ncbi:unnamed protein product [Caenorhabditis brenneri]